MAVPVDGMAETDTPRLLIVDDQPRNLDALEAMLSPLDCVFVRAETADEALLSVLRHDRAYRYSQTRSNESSCSVFTGFAI